MCMQSCVCVHVFNDCYVTHYVRLRVHVYVFAWRMGVCSVGACVVSVCMVRYVSSVCMLCY